MIRKQFFVKAKDIRDALSLHAITFRAGISTAKQTTFPANAGSYSNRIFAPYSVYKGKAALSAAPILPTKQSTLLRRISHRSFASHKTSSSSYFSEPEPPERRLGGGDDDDDVVPSSGISRPLSEILKQLNKKVPDSLVKLRMEDGFSIKYIPWHIVNRIMNLHAPEWSGEVRSITYSADGKSVSVVYRVTLYGTDAEIYRESTGSASVSDIGYGDPVQKAEAMAFRRACARLGLGLHLYHEDML